MTQSCEEFVKSRIEVYNKILIEQYHFYESEATIYYADDDDSDEEDGFELFKNNEYWFGRRFKHFIYDEDYIGFNEFEFINHGNYKKYNITLLDIAKYNNVYSINNNRFLEMCSRFPIELVEELMIERINLYFRDHYYGLLTLEYLKNVLYDNGIYNDVFADEVDLK